jgi:acyl-CoA dehydrogenase
VDFELTETQQATIEGIRPVAGQFTDEYWRERDERGEFPWHFYDALAAGGWVGITIPEQYGGAGLGISEAAVMLEEVAATGAGMNGASSLHLTVFGMNPVVKHGSEEMRQRYLPSVADGSLHVCFGVTEPDAGSDTTRITTRARRKGDRYVIDGRKVWTSKAADCSKVLVLARTTPRDQCEKPTDGMTLLLADLDPKHTEIRPIHKMGRNAVASNELFIDGLEVAVEDRVGEEGKGFSYLLDGLNPERILIAHEALGLGRVALERGARYARERIVFDRPIGANQGIAFPLAQAQMQLSAAGLVARQAAWLYDNGKPCGPEASSAKYLCAEAAFFAADRAVQTHGGMGYAKEYDVERYFREACLMRLAPISQELVMSYVARRVLGLPRSY